MDLVERLKEHATGYEEWRVANPVDGSYVISLSWSESVNPEREAREWLAVRRIPDSWVAGYEVRKVMVQGERDEMMREAADEITRLRSDLALAQGQRNASNREIERLRDENARLQQDNEQAKEAIQTLNAGRPLGDIVGKHTAQNALAENARLRADAAECDALRTKLADILTRTANALKGEPGPLRSHSWHDLPECAERMAKDAEKWREREAKIESLKARGFLGSPLRDAHDSDCATHNEPAYPNGPCDCSAAMQKGG